MEGFVPAPKLQRAKGCISFELNGAKIERLYQSGSAKLMLPKTYGKMTEAVMLNTAGGVTGGDQLDIAIRADGCKLVATSQTAERFYKSSTAPAKIAIHLQAENEAALHWLPQETIIFEGAMADRTIRLDMSANSQCLLAETVIFGRQAMGEEVTKCHFTDNWRIYRDGVLFHAEAVKLEGDIKALLGGRAGGDSAKMFSTILYIGADAEHLASLMACRIAECTSHCAISCWQDRLVIRLLSPNPTTGRADINKLITALRQQPLPRVWQA